MGLRDRTLLELFYAIRTGACLRRAQTTQVFKSSTTRDWSRFLTIYPKLLPASKIARPRACRRSCGTFLLRPVGRPATDRSSDERRLACP